MFKLTQIPDKLELDTVCYECSDITGRIDDYILPENHDRPWSYLYLWETTENFRINDFNSSVVFSIRYPGRTLGHIVVNGLGKIIEATYYPSNMDNNKQQLKYKRIFKNFTSEYIDLSVLAEIQFVQANLKFCPKANKQVIYFIANFIYHCGVDADNIIQEQFHAGYCLHFAILLKEMFPGGEICWCAPFGHMVYMYEDIPYDIEGVNSSDCDHYIPISFIKEGIKDFMHIPGVSFNASQKYIDDAIERYKQHCLYTKNAKDANYISYTKGDKNG